MAGGLAGLGWLGWAGWVDIAAQGDITAVLQQPSHVMVDPAL
ncbi:MAG: hypothetical protein ABIS14_05265 [Sphingomonas sp.]